MANSSVRIRESETWKEILSQGQVWQTVLQEISQSASIQKIRRKEWIFVGCESSYYLAQAAANSWTLLTGQRARALPASEVLLFPQLVQFNLEETQAVLISRSGKTSETVRAAKALSGSLGVPTIGLTCAKGSELEQMCDATIGLPTADEKSMVMTRSFTSMLFSLQILAARCAGNLLFVRDLRRIAEQFAPRIHSVAEAIEAFVAKHSFGDYIFLGQARFTQSHRKLRSKLWRYPARTAKFFMLSNFVTARKPS